MIPSWVERMSDALIGLANAEADLNPQLKD